MSSTHSQKLRKLAEQGSRVVCALESYEGIEVEFSPRYPTDREPWVIRSKTYKAPGAEDFEILERFSGKECKVEDENA